MDTPFDQPAVESCRVFEKYLPLMLVALFVWLAARGARRLFWMAFGLYWAFHWTGAVHHLH